MAGMEGMEGAGGGPGSTLQDEDGRGDGEARQRVAGRRRVGDVAPERPAVLDLEPPDLAGGGGEDRQPLSNERRADHLRVCRERADGEQAVPDLDPAQLVERPEIQESLVSGRAEVQVDVNVGAARERDARA